MLPDGTGIAIPLREKEEIMANNKKTTDTTSDISKDANQPSNTAVGSDFINGEDYSRGLAQIELTRATPILNMNQPIKPN